MTILRINDKTVFLSPDRYWALISKHTKILGIRFASEALLDGKVARAVDKAIRQDLEERCSANPDLFYDEFIRFNWQDKRAQEIVTALLLDYCQHKSHAVLEDLRSLSEYNQDSYAGNYFYFPLGQCFGLTGFLTDRRKPWWRRAKTTTMSVIVSCPDVTSVMGTFEDFVITMGHLNIHCEKRINIKRIKTTAILSSKFDNLILQFSEIKSRQSSTPTLKKFFADCLSFINEFRVMDLLLRNSLFSEAPVLTGQSNEQIQITFCQDLIENRVKFFLFINQVNQFSRFVKKRSPELELPPLSSRIKFFRDKVVEHWDDYVSRFNEGTRKPVGKMAIPTLSWSFSPPEMRERRRNELIEAFSRQGVEIKLEEDAIFEKLADILYPKLEEIDIALSNRGKLREISECLWKYNFPLPFYDYESYVEELVNYFEYLLKSEVIIKEE